MRTISTTVVAFAFAFAGTATADPQGLAFQEMTVKIRVTTLSETEKNRTQQLRIRSRLALAEGSNGISPEVNDISTRHELAGIEDPIWLEIEEPIWLEIHNPQWIEGHDPQWIEIHDPQWIEIVEPIWLEGEEPIWLKGYDPVWVEGEDPIWLEISVAAGTLKQAKGGAWRLPKPTDALLPNGVQIVLRNTQGETLHDYSEEITSLKVSLKEEDGGWTLVIGATALFEKPKINFFPFGTARLTEIAIGENFGSVERESLRWVGGYDSAGAN